MENAPTNSSASHTPGPWTLDADPQLEGFVFGPETDSDPAEQSHRRLIAACSHHGSKRGADEDAANARLIAAAPDLLEALDSIKAFASGKTDSPENLKAKLADCEATARAAIARASKGE